MFCIYGCLACVFGWFAIGLGVLLTYAFVLLCCVSVCLFVCFFVDCFDLIGARGLFVCDLFPGAIFTCWMGVFMIVAGCIVAGLWVALL